MSKLKLFLGILVFALVILVAIPRYYGDHEVSRAGLARWDIKALSDSLELFKNVNGYYPTTEQGLKYLVSPPKGEKQILDRLPKDPWVNDYHYAYPGQFNKNSYDIVSYAADNMPGGEGENKDISNWK
jgi:general secretion pathway protein G